MLLQFFLFFIVIAAFDYAVHFFPAFPALVSQLLHVGTFIRFIDELDALHVTFMKFVAEESALMNDHKKVESYVLVHALYSKSYRHVNAPREAFELMISDLKSCALIKVSKHVADYGGVTVYEQNLMAFEQTGEGPLFAVTSLGQKFLEFITEHESLP